MKKHLLGFLGTSALLFIGCGKIEKEVVMSDEMKSFVYMVDGTSHDVMRALQRYGEDNSVKRDELTNFDIEQIEVLDRDETSNSYDVQIVGKELDSELTVITSKIYWDRHKIVNIDHLTMSPLSEKDKITGFPEN